MLQKLLPLLVILQLSIPCAAAERLPQVAIIIDDVGALAGSEKPFAELGIDLTFSLLPQYPDSVAAGVSLFARGFELMLHLPAEPLKRSSMDGPGFLTVELGRRAFTAQLRKHLDAIPGIRGVNLHMGSRLSQQPKQMRWILDKLADRDLFFIDSRTIHTSVAYRIALQRNLRSEIRDVFIDHQRKVPLIIAELNRALSVAVENGRAIIIGHPHPETLAALKLWLPKVRHRLRFVSVSRLLSRKQRRRPQEFRSPRLLQSRESDVPLDRDEPGEEPLPFFLHK